MSASSTSLEPLTPPPPFSPISLLPFELVEAIIKSTVPLHFEAPTYRARQATLLSLCLVSRLFHQIAKPLLFAVAYIDGPYQVEPRNLRQEEDKGSLCRELMLESTSEEAPIAVEHLGPILGSHTNLTRLTLETIKGEVDLVPLGLMKHLSFLLLSELRATVTRPIVFRALSTLSVLCSRLDESSLPHLDPASFPSLRAIGWHEVYSHQVPSWKHLFDRLIPQVENLSLASNLPRLFESSSLELPSQKTLSDVPVGSISFRDLRAMEFGRILDVPTTPSEALSHLATLESQLLGNLLAKPPSLLYLPPEFNTFAQSDADTQARLNHFLNECRNRKVEVVFEELIGQWGEDPGFSPDFTRRMKERKRSETIAAA